MHKKITLFSLTWPIFIENFLRMSLGNVNTFMLSKLSDNAVGAVGVANQIVNMVLMIYGIVGNGTAIILNQYLGAGEKKTASRVAVVAMIANLTFGALLSLILALFARFFLQLMNVPDELMRYAVQYLTIIGAASFMQALIATISGIMRSYGYARFPMYIALGMNVFNAAGNYIVIFRPFGLPSHGVSGVAACVVTAQLLGVAVMLYILLRKLDISLDFRSLIPFRVHLFREILRIGVPSGGEFISYNASQIVITYFITTMGTVALATRVYTMNIMFFMLVLGMSIGQGAMIRVGHQIGAGDIGGAYRTCMKSLKIGVLVDSTLAILFALAGTRLLGIFTDDPSIIRMGSTLLFIAILLEPGRVPNMVVSNCLRAAGDVRFPVVVGVFSMWGIAVALSYVLGIHFGLGLIGVWIAFISDEWFRGLIMLRRWRSREWQSMVLVREKKPEATLPS
jgi:putative MATE family efflux protein